MYYVCETLKMLENVVKGSEFGYTREQRYTKKLSIIIIIIIISIVNQTCQNWLFLF